MELASFALQIEARPDFYDYSPVMNGSVEWHVNFADAQLFGFYGGGLFAQDEMQVAEHPVLASVREVMDLQDSAFTEKNGKACPVLVMGAERRCRFDLRPNPAAGLPHGMYGNSFAHAPTEAIRAVTTILDSPATSNIIAMAAPGGNYGLYSKSEIKRILLTAFTAFHGAVIVSGDCPTVIHSGWWGCGAFGGNRLLMALLQMAAANMAGIRRLVFHAGNADGVQQLDEAKSLAESLLKIPLKSESFFNHVEALGFEWGMSNGT